MIYDNLERIEELESQLERCQRRGELEIATQYEEELIEARIGFIERLVRRQEDFENDTFAQRGRRQRYEDLIEEQKAALKEKNDEFADELTIGDVAAIKQ